MKQIISFPPPTFFFREKTQTKQPTCLLTRPLFFQSLVLFHRLEHGKHDEVFFIAKEKNINCITLWERVLNLCGVNIYFSEYFIAIYFYLFIGWISPISCTVILSIRSIISFVMFKKALILKGYIHNVVCPQAVATLNIG